MKQEVKADELLNTYKEMLLRCKEDAEKAIRLDKGHHCHSRTACHGIVDRVSKEFNSEYSEKFQGLKGRVRELRKENRQLKNKLNEIHELVQDNDELLFVATCPYCNKPMQHVRPGKWQPTCDCQGRY